MRKKDYTQKLIELCNQPGTEIADCKIFHDGPKRVTGTIKINGAYDEVSIEIQGAEVPKRMYDMLMAILPLIKPFQ